MYPFGRSRHLGLTEKVVNVILMKMMINKSGLLSQTIDFRRHQNW
jgi:hypothetical protein